MNPAAPLPETRHAPVLPAEIIDGLSPKPGGVFVDATIGAAGHAVLLAKHVGEHGRLIGLDRDASMLAIAAARLKGAECQVTLVHSNFADLRQVLDTLSIPAVNGVLADLGMCTDQLDAADRGLSFQQEGPLDMRLDQSVGEPASSLIRQFSERELADVFWQYGEERYSRRIARKIVEVRRLTPFETTTQLAAIVRRCMPRPRGRRERIDPATRVFQALRIAVNDELASLETFLSLLPNCVKDGGRAAVISFHSLEDRFVKRAFQDSRFWRRLTKKPLQASEEEQRSNPRSRSAKLRVAERIERDVS